MCLEKYSSNLYCTGFSTLELFMILIKAYTLPVYTCVHSIRGFCIRTPYGQSQVLSQKQYKKRNERVTLVNNLKGSFGGQWWQYFFLNIGIRAHKSTVYFSISLEKGNWLKLKEESNLHFIHQLSKDLHLKIIF